jgi:sensor c-di-GMP phosphodiesterase-like protein
VKGKKRISTFNIFIFFLCIIAAVLVFSIFKGIISIKKENSQLKKQIHILEKTKKELVEENSNLNEKIKSFQEPEVSSPDIPDGWKIYRCLDLGFEVGYPEGGKVDISEDYSPSAHPEQNVRVSVISNDNNTYVNINAVFLDSYKSINEYIKGVYEYKVYVKKTVYINNQKYDLYKLSGSKHYYIFLKNKSYILDLNSPSEEFLLKVLGTFKFI